MESCLTNVVIDHAHETMYIHTWTWTMQGLRNAVGMDYQLDWCFNLPLELLSIVTTALRL